MISLKAKNKADLNHLRMHTNIIEEELNVSLGSSNFSYLVMQNKRPGDKLKYFHDENFAETDGFL